MARKINKKPIVELEKPGGKVKKYWESARLAADAYKISTVIICYNVKGTTSQAKGHYFRYATSIEIEQYTQIINSITTSSTDSIPVEPITVPTNENVDTIPEVVKREENQIDTLTPFERLLEAGKNKLMDNSK